MLYFATGDHLTDHNLKRLSHLASLSQCDGDAEQMHQWLIATMSSIDALPGAARRHFTGYYFLGDSHFTMSPERRSKVWRELAEELAVHVNAAHADPALSRDGPTGPLDASDRRQTRGEQILALCADLDRTFWGGTEFDATLNAIDRVAVGAVKSDVAELKRLSSRKRIPNVDEHRYAMRRLIEHMKIVANQLHHIERG